MDEENKYLLSEFWQFYCPEDLEASDVETETGIRKSQEAINDFINKQKSANRTRKTATDTDSLFSAT